MTFCVKIKGKHKNCSFYARTVKDPVKALVKIETWGQFHQRSTPSFYVIKTAGAKAARRILMKLNPGCTSLKKTFRYNVLGVP
jgi:hypothetical protein